MSCPESTADQRRQFLNLLIPCVLRYADRDSRQMLFDALRDILSREDGVECIARISKWVDGQLAGTVVANG
jgi:hypothetical protein